MNKNQTKLPKQRKVRQAIRTSSTHGGCTLGEIANKLGIGREMVRKIEGKALITLRQHLQDRGIKACDLL